MHCYEKRAVGGITGSAVTPCAFSSHVFHIPEAHAFQLAKANVEGIASAGGPDDTSVQKRGCCGLLPEMNLTRGRHMKELRGSALQSCSLETTIAAHSSHLTSVVPATSRSHLTSDGSGQQQISDASLHHSATEKTLHRALYKIIKAHSARSQRALQAITISNMSQVSAIEAH